MNFASASCGKTKDLKMASISVEIFEQIRQKFVLQKVGQNFLCVFTFLRTVVVEETIESL